MSVPFPLEFILKWFTSTVYTQGLGKEVESQQLIIENLEQRIATISTNLDPEQQAQLTGELKALYSDYSELCAAVKLYERDLEKVTGERQSFEATLGEIQRKLVSFAAQSREIEYLPLASIDVEKISDKFKVGFLESLIDRYCFTSNFRINISKMKTAGSQMLTFTTSSSSQSPISCPYFSRL